MNLTHLFCHQWVAIWVVPTFGSYERCCYKYLYADVFLGCALHSLRPVSSAGSCLLLLHFEELVFPKQSFALLSEPMKYFVPAPPRL